MIITIKNSDGVAVTVGNSYPFILSSIEGTETVENNIETDEQYNLDGAVFVSQKLGVRDLRVEGRIVGNHERDVEDLRRGLIEAGNPKKTFTFTVETNAKKYEIDVLAVISPSFKVVESHPDLLDFSFQFKALDPYWRDVSFYDSLIPLSKVVNMFQFPLDITKDYIFATVKSGDIIQVNNDGDVSTGSVFSIKTFTICKNPKIYNVLTQEFFGFEGTYEAGTEFLIDTRRGKKKVVKIVNRIEVNAMSERLENSTFLSLEKGANYLQVQADSGVDGVIVNLTFTPLVMGV